MWLSLVTIGISLKAIRLSTQEVGIRLDPGDGTTSDDNQVLDNTIISSGLEGILVVGKRVVIQGNTIDQSGENGIEVVIHSGPLSVKVSLSRTTASQTVMEMWH